MPDTPLEEQFVTLTNSVKELGDGVRRTAEIAQKEAENAGKLSAETKATADKLLAQANETALQVT